MIEKIKRKGIVLFPALVCLVGVIVVYFFWLQEYRKASFEHMIDEVQHVSIRENQEIELTYTEFEILKLLAKHPGIVFSKEQIYDSVWKESYSGDYNIVMSHIRNIREKIEDNSSKPIYIQTVWGVGYKFNTFS